MLNLREVDQSARDAAADECTLHFDRECAVFPTRRQTTSSIGTLSQEEMEGRGTPWNHASLDDILSSYTGTLDHSKEDEGIIYRSLERPSTPATSC